MYYNNIIYRYFHLIKNDVLIKRIFNDWQCSNQSINSLANILVYGLI